MSIVPCFWLSDLSQHLCRCAFFSLTTQQFLTGCLVTGDWLTTLALTRFGLSIVGLWIALVTKLTLVVSYSCYITKVYAHCIGRQLVLV